MRRRHGGDAAEGGHGAGRSAGHDEEESFIKSRYWCIPEVCACLEDVCAAVKQAAGAEVLVDRLRVAAARAIGGERVSERDD